MFVPVQAITQRGGIAMHIDQLIKTRGGFLAIGRDGTPTPISDREALEMMQAAGSVPVVVLNLAKSLADFRRLAGTRQKFSSHGVQQVSGASYKQVRGWTDAGIITACETTPQGAKMYDFESAFIAGIAGGLRRRGTPQPIIKRVADFIRGEVPAETGAVKV
jgi:hypothetical protein